MLAPVIAATISAAMVKRTLYRNKAGKTKLPWREQLDQRLKRTYARAAATSTNNTQTSSSGLGIFLRIFQATKLTTIPPRGGEHPRMNLSDRTTAGQARIADGWIVGQISRRAQVLIGVVCH